MQKASFFFLFCCLLLILACSVFGQSLEEIKQRAEELKREKLEHIRAMQDIDRELADISRKIAAMEFEEFSDRKIFTQTVESSWMRKYPYILSEKVVAVPKGNSVTITAYHPKENAWEAEFNGKTGYISDESIMQTVQIRKKKAYEEKRYQEEQQKPKVIISSPALYLGEGIKGEKPPQKKIMQVDNRPFTVSQARREQLIDTFGKRAGNDIADGYYWIGMTDIQAKESLGKPDKINRTAKKNRLHEQWIYKAYNLYLYFDNGKLTTFQNSD